MKPGEISAPIQGGNNGIVIKVLELQEPSPEQMKQNWDTAKETLLQQKRNELKGYTSRTCATVWKKRERSKSTRRKWNA